MIWCLHGAVGQASDWDSFSSAMASKGISCRAVELWRFLECEALSLEAWAESFNLEVKAAENEQNILVGYSMGGRLALHALLEDSELWDRVVIVSAHPGLVTDSERLERMARDAEWAGLALTAEWSAFLNRWDRQEVLLEVDLNKGMESQRPSRSKLVNRRRAIARSFMEWSLGKQGDLRASLDKVLCPLLWISGEKDEKFSLLAKDVVSLIENGEHLVIPNSGHRVPWEVPEEFEQAVLSFIR